MSQSVGQSRTSKEYVFVGAPAIANSASDDSILFVLNELDCRYRCRYGCTCTWTRTSINTTAITNQSSMIISSMVVVGFSSFSSSPSNVNGKSQSDFNFVRKFPIPTWQEDWYLQQQSLQKKCLLLAWEWQPPYDCPSVEPHESIITFRVGEILH